VLYLVSSSDFPRLDTNSFNLETGTEHSTSNDIELPGTSRNKAEIPTTIVILVTPLFRNQGLLLSATPFSLSIQT
jgi:hypothetical protein